MTEPEQAAPDASRDRDAHQDTEADDGALGTSASGTSAAGTSAAGTSALGTRRRRLLFRATHRGTFENDLMIGNFVRTHLANLTEGDIDALEAVMNIPDTDLADWLTGRVAIPPEEETPMLRRMREFLTR